MTAYEHGDPTTYAMTPAQRLKHCFDNPIPTRRRQCYYQSAFPCNGHCGMSRLCLVAEVARNA